jgi:hypothetical protein
MRLVEECSDYNCTLSAINHKLNVSGHVIIRNVYSSFGMWNSYTQICSTFLFCSCHLRLYAFICDCGFLYAVFIMYERNI